MLYDTHTRKRRHETKRTDRHAAGGSQPPSPTPITNSHSMVARAGVWLCGIGWVVWATNTRTAKQCCIQSDGAGGAAATTHLIGRVGQRHRQRRRERVRDHARELCSDQRRQRLRQHFRQQVFKL